MGGFGPTEMGAIWQRPGNRKHTGEGRGGWAEAKSVSRGAVGEQPEEALNTRLRRFALHPVTVGS